MREQSFSPAAHRRGALCYAAIVLLYVYVAVVMKSRDACVLIN